MAILLCWYKRYSICMISLFSLFELFAAVIYVNNIGSLINSLFGVTIFNPFPSLTNFDNGVDIFFYHLLVVVKHLVLQTILHSQILQVLNSKDYIWALIYFFQHLINHRINENIFLASHYIILKLYQTHFFLFHLSLKNN